MTRYKYDLIEDYFEEINTEAKAYWLGYILADGHVMTRKSKKSRHYGLSIASIDKDQLYNLKDALSYSGVIYYRQKGGGYEGSKGCYSLTIHRIKLCQDLLKYKSDSNQIKIPTMADDLIRHFIRGFFDGDGSVYSWIANVVMKRPNKVYTYKTFMLEASIIGCESILKDIEAQFIKIGLRFRYRKSKTDYMNFIVISHKTDLQKFREYLYKDATVFLQRKFDKWHDTPHEWETIHRKPRICKEPVIQS